MCGSHALKSYPIKSMLIDLRPLIVTIVVCHGSDMELSIGFGFAQANVLSDSAVQFLHIENDPIKN